MSTTRFGENMPELLKFNPDWFKDPPPWVLNYLTKEQVIAAARIQVEFQRAVQAAYGKALTEFEGVLAKGAAAGR